MRRIVSMAVDRLSRHSTLDKVTQEMEKEMYRLKQYIFMYAKRELSQMIRGIVNGMDFFG